MSSGRVLFLLIAVAISASCGSEKPAETVSYSVTITGSITPEPVRYAGSYQYMLDGKRTTKDLSDAGSISFEFECDEFVYIRIHRTSADGIISMTVSREGKIVFDSPPNSTRQPIIYTAPPAP